MTLLVNYPSKKFMKTKIGEPLRFRETSLLGSEYKGDGKFTVAYRPTIWPYPNERGREFYAIVTMKDHVIAKVE
jgi:hypothetical protein